MKKLDLFFLIFKATDGKNRIRSRILLQIIADPRKIGESGTLAVSQVHTGHNMIRLAALVATAGETKDLFQGAPPLRTTAVVETLRKKKNICQ
jgi:hypothetical protein